MGLGMVGLGLAAGLAAAIAFGRFLSGFLFETSPSDPMTFALVLLVLLLAGLVASFLPARRAASINPTHALRSE
jgi:ABC-type antimicrobial peptide transport system permease subunit